MAGVLRMKGTGLQDVVGKMSRVKTKDLEGHIEAFYLLCFVVFYVIFSYGLDGLNQRVKK